MTAPRIAIVSFPGNNCEVESMRAIKQAGMEPVFFLWNDSVEKLQDIEGYFIPGGFSYEDRGRAGMVAARDPLLTFIAEEASKGKVVIGNCNGAQILVESGLVPVGYELKMCLAKNIVEDEAVGFLNEWVWITPSCSKDRCATSNWEGAMHIPLAHGEGRFTTQDKDLFEELKKNNQIAFSYCTEDGTVSEDKIVTPNGSTYAIAGICNPAGNVVALMPHPERTPNGAAYFASMKQWIQEKRSVEVGMSEQKESAPITLQSHNASGAEIFIDTIIVNNEERTVEQAAKRIDPSISLKQYRYIQTAKEPKEILTHLSHFNPNKEVAYIRKGSTFTKWDSDTKSEVSTEPLFASANTFLRRDNPDTEARHIGKGAETGICYAVTGVESLSKEVYEVLYNRHAFTLETVS